MKRYCQTLKLREDPELIAQYVEEHAHVWPEIKAGYWICKYISTVTLCS